LFLWTEVNGADTYELEVEAVSSDGSVAGVFVVDGLSDSEHRHTSPLQRGRSYRWRARAEGPGGVGPWSSEGEFELSGDDPGEVTDMSPAGFISERSPVFSWTAAPFATRYEIELNDLDAGTWLPAGSSVTTSYTFTAPLSEGPYRWWIRAWNGSKPGSWQSEEFEVAPPAPAVPDALTPKGSIFEVTPTLRWQSALDATTYDVELRRAGSATALIERSALTETELELTTALDFGSYAWIVRGRRGVEVSDWSAEISFTVLPRDLEKVTQIAPLDATDTVRSRPSFRWDEVPGAGHYELWVDEIGGSSKVLYESAVTGLEYRPSAPLPKGRYRWWIRAWLDQEKGPWNGTAFDLRELAQPRVLGPASPTRERQPSFTWDPVAGATRYEIWLRQVGGQDKIAYADDLVEERFTPPQELPSGHLYHWWVRAWSGAEDYGAWSANSLRIKN
jgi:hypothetical protein